MRSCIKVNETNESVIILINENSEIKEIIEAIKKKLYLLKKVCKEKNLPVFVQGRKLSDIEKQEVKNILQEKVKTKIMFEMPQELGLHGIKKSFNQEIESSQATFHRGAVRSGQRIEYDGTIVVLGDVNGGAEIVAGDNVIVLGVLRGLAHAGAKGNKKAIVAAASIECKQIRIADVIKQIEEVLDEEGNVIPQSRKTYAYVEEDNLILE